MVASQQEHDQEEGVELFDEEDQSYGDHDGDGSITSLSYASENSPLLSASSSYQRKHSLQSGLGLPAALPGMRIRCHLIDPKNKGTLTSCTPEEALAGAKQQPAPFAGFKKKPRPPDQYWVDIDADPDDADELRAWLRQIHLPNFVIEVLAEPPETWASQVVPLQGAVLAVLRILPENTASDDMAHVAALSLRNMLITFTSCPRTDTGGLYDSTVAQMTEAERLPRATCSGALMAWLRYHLDRTSRSTRELRYAVLTMDEAMDRDITSVPLTELIAVKDQLLRLLSVAEEQCECVESLAAATLTGASPPAGTTTRSDHSSLKKPKELYGSVGLDFSSVRGSLASLVATAGATERMALRLEKHILDLRQRSEQHDHSIMNRRLAVLTVLSAIFLPLTLLTGIWGMNFAQSKYKGQCRGVACTTITVLCTICVSKMGQCNAISKFALLRSFPPLSVHSLHLVHFISARAK